MPSYSAKSKDRLATCDERLQKVFNEAIKYWDISILCGHRNETEQNEALRNKTSTKAWPNSKHNTLPSKAVDAAPYPVDWKDIKRWMYFAGLVTGLAQGMGIKLRSGVDWDGDLDISEHTLIDAPHFEVVD